jgi:hypothetical protein
VRKLVYIKTNTLQINCIEVLDDVESDNSMDVVEED